MRRFAALAAGAVLVAWLWPSDPPRSTAPDAPGEEEHASTLELERWFFDDWHGPEHGAVLEPELLASMWTDIRRLPTAEHRLGESWQLLGPSGFPAGQSVYSGRILDVAVVYDGAEQRIKVFLAAASGGLWRYDDGLDVYTSLTDDLETQAVGTVSVDPDDLSTILIGTGEWLVRGGAGIFRSTNGGNTWTKVLEASSSGSAVHRIRHVSSSVVMASSNAGVFRSTDGGATWSLVMSGNFFDMAIDRDDPDDVYTIEYDNAALRSYAHVSSNGGASFFRALIAGNAKRGGIARAQATSNVLYAAVCDTDNSLKAIYKSHGGTVWTEVLDGSVAGNNYMGTQGWSNNVVVVHPNDPDIAYVGGVGWKKTTDGGATWTDMSTHANDAMHVDLHALTYFVLPVSARRPSRFGDLARGGNPPALFIGHDGGLTFGVDDAYQATINQFPITQYTHISASLHSPLVIGGGSQDNGISLTTDGGATWRYVGGGDGSDLAIDPADDTRMWANWGVIAGAISFPRYRTTNSGNDWTYINSGIVGAGTWYTDLVHDQVAPVWLYTNEGKRVYQSTDMGDTWTELGAFDFTVRAVNAGRYSFEVGGAVYVALSSSEVGNRVHVFDDGSWHPRDAGLPTTTGASVRTVVPHPRNPDVCFALMNGLNTPGNKVYLSTNRGASWTNVTGNLPNVPVSSLIANVHDHDEYYLGSEMGAYWTPDRGVSWQRRNTGMPEAVIITDMAFVDDTSTNEFHVLAGTYGRSIYRALVTPPAVDAEVAEAAPPALTLDLVGPNPHRGATRFAFTLPEAGRARLDVYDVSGRKVATVVDERLPAGRHEIAFGSEKVAPGAYLYRLEAGGVSVSGKMLVVR